MAQPGLNKQQITKEELEKILQVNSKAIELEMAVVKQNEEIMENLECITGEHEALRTEQIRIFSEFISTRKEVSDKAKEVIKEVVEDISSEITQTQTKLYDKAVEQSKILDDVYKILKETKENQFKIIVLLSAGAFAIAMEVVRLIIALAK